MSQPGQMPAASSPPQRTAAASHTQEVSGTPVLAALLCTGRTQVPDPWAASSGRSLPGLLPVHPHQGPGKDRGSVLPLGRWLEVTGDSVTWTKCVGRGASQIGGVISVGKSWGVRPESHMGMKVLKFIQDPPPPKWVGWFNWTAGFCLPCTVRAAGRGCLEK